MSNGRYAALRRRDAAEMRAKGLRWRDLSCLARVTIAIGISSGLGVKLVGLRSFFATALLPARAALKASERLLRKAAQHAYETSTLLGELVHCVLYNTKKFCAIRDRRGRRSKKAVGEPLVIPIFAALGSIGSTHLWSSPSNS